VTGEKILVTGDWNPETEAGLQSFHVLRELPRSDNGRQTFGGGLRCWSSSSLPGATGRGVLVRVVAFG